MLDWGVSTELVQVRVAVCCARAGAARMRIAASAIAADAERVFIFVILLNLVAQAFLPVPQVDWGLECVQRGSERTRWVDFAVWHGGAVGVFGHGMSKIPHGFAGTCPY